MDRDEHSKETRRNYMRRLLWQKQKDNCATVFRFMEESGNTPEGLAKTLFMNGYTLQLRTNKYGQKWLEENYGGE